MMRFRVTYVGDGLWEGECPQLPHLTCEAESPGEALEAIQDAVEYELSGEGEWYDSVDFEEYLK